MVMQITLLITFFIIIIYKSMYEFSKKAKQLRT